MLKIDNLATEDESAAEVEGDATAPVVDCPPVVETESERGNAEVDQDIETEEKRWYFPGRDSVAFFVSLFTHVGIITALAAIPIIRELDIPQLIIRSEPDEVQVEEFKIPEDIVYSDVPSEQIGSNSIGNLTAGISLAPELNPISEVVTPELPQTQLAISKVSLDIDQALAKTESTAVIRGVTGFGVSGTQGAVDRVTYEIIKSIEERPTLVVWLFDASVSLSKRRDEIRNRFDTIYEEIGLVTEARKKEGKIKAEDPLLTSVVSFGSEVVQLTKKPTADIAQIRSAIDKIELDTSGVEMVFSAIYMAAEKYKKLRVDRGDGPERNVLIIAVTDERGDDTQGMDKTIDICRRFSIPVYVMGVPAPFGRPFTYIKYVDPDPRFDQSPQWAQIDQGPETWVPERIQLGYKDNYYQEPVIDSGFGPYALSRLCYESGGIFFTIHPNRKYDGDVGENATEAFASRLQRFFDPVVMERYQPDYLSAAEYEQMLRKSPMRAALVQASQLSRTGVLERPRLRFVKRDEAAFVGELTTAQQISARLDPGLTTICQVLGQGEPSRNTELSARWLASFDLSYAAANAERIRNETYNQMLGKAKRGMNFENPANNTWTLEPSNEVSVNSRLQKEADEVRAILTRIVEEHKGTPWAYLAKHELDHPIGWKWKESNTDLSPQRNMQAAGNNNNVPMPNDDQARMLAPPAPKRPIPKL
jgi:hypothetical protein